MAKIIYEGSWRTSSQPRRYRIVQVENGTIVAEQESGKDSMGEIRWTSSKEFPLCSLANAILHDFTQLLIEPSRTES